MIVWKKVKTPHGTWPQAGYLGESEVFRISEDGLHTNNGKPYILFTWLPFEGSPRNQIQFGAKIKDLKQVAEELLVEWLERTGLEIKVKSR